MSIPRMWLVVAAVLAVVWGGVSAVMRLTEDHISTPEKVIGLMDSAPWLGQKDVSGTERKDYIDKVVASVNKLDFEQRRVMREENDAAGQRFFDSLSQEERRNFVNRTVEQHFQAVMKGFNSMSPEERKRMVERVRRDMREQRGEGADAARMQEEDQVMFENVVSKGIEAYYRDANTETKMDLAPVLEEMHARMQGGRR